MKKSILAAIISVFASLAMFTGQASAVPYNCSGIVNKAANPQRYSALCTNGTGLYRAVAFCKWFDNGPYTSRVGPWVREDYYSTAICPSDKPLLHNWSIQKQ
jgi:hypothetical protein